MRHPLQTLAQRRETLVLRAQAQRTELQEAVSAVRQRLSFADRTFAFAAKLKRQPVVSGVIVAALFALLVGPRRGIQWISYAATVYSLVRRVRWLIGGDQR